MNRSLSRSVLGAGTLVAGLAVLTPSTHAQDLSRLSGQVRVDGSSTVYPITEAVAEEFGKEATRVRVTVGVSGTGGGFKRFAIGETDISDASRPIKAKEAEAAKAAGIEYIEIPVAYDGLTFVVNKQNTWANDITVEELKKIFLDGSTVDSWNDIRPSYPDVPIKIFSPGTDSGTFDYFKEVVVGDGSVRADIAVSEDDNVLVNGVVGDKGAIGYFGCAYYFENEGKLKALAVHNGERNVLPNPDTIEGGEYAPFSRPLFIYVNSQAARRPEVKAFVEFYLKHAAELASEVGYVPLPSVVYERATRNFRTNRTGSQYLTEAGDHRKGPVIDIYQ